MIVSYHLITVLSFSVFIYIATRIILPYNISWAERHGFVAHPSDRKIHKKAIPEAGGLSFAILIVLSQFVLGYVFRNQKYGIPLIKLAIIGLISIGFGLFDDKYESRARYKLIWQIGLGIVMFIFKYRVQYLTNPFGEHLILGWMSFPFTVLWYVIILNAINLIDGIDGLACGITIIVCGVLFAVGLKEQNLLVITLSLFLISGNLAFIGANFPPAKVFLGDTGTLFIGLNLAAISTAGVEQYKGITTMTLMIPISVMAVPLIDVFLAVFRRIKLGNIFKADKEHIHHIMLRAGLSQKEVAITVYIVTFLFGMIALGFSFSTKKILFSVLLGLLVFMVVLAYILMRAEKK